MEILNVRNLNDEMVSIFVPSIKSSISFWCENVMTFECDKYPLLDICGFRGLREYGIIERKNHYALVIYRGEICMLSSIGRNIKDKLISYVESGNKSALINIHIRMEMKSLFPDYENSFCSSPDMDSFDKEKLQTDFNNGKDFIDDFIKSRKKWHESPKLVSYLETKDISLHKYKMGLREEKLKEVLD